MAIGGIAELEDVAGEAFNGEILVDRAHDHVRFEVTGWEPTS
jgi:hypothetical protein